MAFQNKLPALAPLMSKYAGAFPSYTCKAPPLKASSPSAYSVSAARPDTPHC